MFNVGLGECVVVLLVAIYVIKPQHFPVIAKIILQRVGSFKQAINRVKAEFNALAQDSNNHHES